MQMHRSLFDQYLPDGSWLRDPLPRGPIQLRHATRQLDTGGLVPQDVPRRGFRICCACRKQKRKCRWRDASSKIKGQKAGCIACVKNGRSCHVKSLVMKHGPKEAGSGCRECAGKPSGGAK
ncbi:hypothetical protein KVT40_001597 [Elsinoe batatas]|uniref:Zn(2)-C6 fungal-type domain-containing protein n=1 Tax=Elsinoe batatas TaxID=2601811 RepID=A0A8K0LD19_9PEZI|nr:hypothetical protein KVT40_001597 [Elsinoe batatas]